MRIVVVTIMAGALWACKPVPDLPALIADAAARNNGTAQMDYYERRIARGGEILMPPTLLRLSGTLIEKNGCLLLNNENGDHVLIFEKRKANFDPLKMVLSAGSVKIVVGELISVGGPFNQASEDFDLQAIKNAVIQMQFGWWQARM